MCKYCDNSTEFNAGTLTGKISGNEMSFTYNAYSCDSSLSNEDTTITINYCPFCAKHLSPNSAQKQKQLDELALQKSIEANNTFCEACSKSFINHNAYLSHLTGKKHISKQAILNNIKKKNSLSI